MIARQAPPIAPTCVGWCHDLIRHRNREKCCRLPRMRIPAKARTIACHEGVRGNPAQQDRHVYQDVWGRHRHPMRGEPSDECFGRTPLDMRCEPACRYIARQVIVMIAANPVSGTARRLSQPGFGMENFFLEHRPRPSRPRSVTRYQSPAIGLITRRGHLSASRCGSAGSRQTLCRSRLLAAAHPVLTDAGIASRRSGLGHQLAIDHCQTIAGRLVVHAHGPL